MKRGTRIFLMTFIVTILVITLLVGGVFAISFFGLFGSDTFDADMIDLNLSSTIYYTDDKGVSHELILQMCRSTCPMHLLPLRTNVSKATVV